MVKEKHLLYCEDAHSWILSRSLSDYKSIYPAVSAVLVGAGANALTHYEE